MLHLYSIIPLDTVDDHLEEVCQDVRMQYETGVATTALAMMTLNPEGDPPIDKVGILSEKYGKMRDRLAQMGLECGILVQASIGHGWVPDHPFGFQKYINLTDGKAQNVVCPYDEGFRRHFKSVMAAVAKQRPASIMVDDDFRLMFRGGKGCACPLHMAAFNRLAGTNMTREELFAHTQGTSPEDVRYTRLFIETQRDSLLGAARAYREGVDSVDPNMPVSFCACGPAAEFADEIAHILAGEGNPIVVRLNNGSYNAAGARWFSNVMLRAAAQAAVLDGKVDVLLAETDTCPQNRYSTAAQMVHAHFTGTILEGASGAKHWITRLHTHEPGSGKAYRRILGKYRGFYEALAALVPHLKWLGCRMPVSATPGYGFGSSPDIYATNGWSSCVIERMGLPMYFSAKPGGAVFLDGPADAFLSDDEIKDLFRGPLFLASDTAMRLNARGFQEYTGVEVAPWNGPHASGEILPIRNNTCNAQEKLCSLTPLNDSVIAESTVFHLIDGQTRQPLFPGVTSYDNPLGGMTFVFSGTPKASYDIVHAFSFLNESRKLQLVDLLQRANCLPVYYPEDAEVYLRAARCPDGSLFVAFFNIGLDPLTEIPLTVEQPVSRVERLLPDGSRAACAFRAEGDTIVAELPAGTLDPVILFLYE